MTALAWQVGNSKIPPVQERIDRKGVTIMGYGRGGGSDIYNTRGASE